MLVKIGKGIELDVDTSKLGQTARDHVMYMGLRNILMDSHANHTADSSDDCVAESRATAERKLQSLYNGEVRAAGTRASDPIAVQMRQLAQRDAKKAILASGRKMRDVKSELVTAVVNKLLEKNDAAYRKAATKMVQDAQALDVDLSGVV